MDLFFIGSLDYVPSHMCDINQIIFKQSLPDVFNMSGITFTTIFYSNCESKEGSRNSVGRCVEIWAPVGIFG